jgi:hypothetical protein
MTGDANEVRDLMPSLNRGGSPPTYFAVTAWLSNTQSGRLGEEASIDKVGRNPDGYSIASEDELPMTAQSGDQQAFVEHCLRHSPMVKEEDLLDCKKPRRSGRRASGYLAPSLQAFRGLSSHLQILYMAHEHRDQHGVDDSSQEEDEQATTHRSLECRKRTMGSNGACGPLA